jgi:hypothetical protein
MAKKKKKLEDDAWMFHVRPFVPGLVSNLSLPFTAPVPPEVKRKLLMPRTGPWGGAEFGQEFFRAWGYYTLAGALDPKNPLVDARIAATFFGVGWWAGLGIAIVAGAPIMGLALTIIDPKDRYQGGLDETRAYHAAVAGVAGAHPNLNKEILFGAGSWGTVV